MKRTHQFTLIEMLTVISVILILTALVASGGMSALKSKAKKQCNLELKSIEQALDLHYEEKGYYPYVDLGNSNYGREFRIFVNNFSDEAQTILRKSQIDAEPWSSGNDSEYLNDPFGQPYTYYISRDPSPPTELGPYIDGTPAVYSNGVDTKRSSNKGYGDPSLDEDNIWMGTPRAKVIK